MREMSVTEQRYKAVLAVIGDGRRLSEVAADWGVSRRNDTVGLALSPSAETAPDSL